MTIRTIEEIGKLLEEKAFAAKRDYTEYRDKMKRRYATEWIKPEMTKEEKDLYNEFWEDMRKWDSVLKDFENHNF